MSERETKQAETITALRVALREHEQALSRRRFEYRRLQAAMSRLASVVGFDIPQKTVNDIDEYPGALEEQIKRLTSSVLDYRRRQK